MNDKDAQDLRIAIAELESQRATLHTLSREVFDQLRRERPDLAAAFGDFLLRTLADRLTLTQRMVTAMSG